MRLATILMAAAMAVGLNASAPAEDAATKDYVPCGCGGPKAIYAAQYGTVQPPALQKQMQEREAAEAAAAAAEANQPATAAPETTDGGS
jgi:hypothetical protein